jgi:hypothetical protein
MFFFEQKIKIIELLTLLTSITHHNDYRHSCGNNGKIPCMRFNQSISKNMNSYKHQISN